MPPLFALRPRPHPRKCERRTPNTEHRTPNAERRTSNIEHRTSNIEHRTSNIEHRTSNIEHRTSNIEQKSGAAAARPLQEGHGRPARVPMQGHQPPCAALFSSPRFDVQCSMSDVRVSSGAALSQSKIQNLKSKIQSRLRPCQFGLCRFLPSSLALTPRSTSKIYSPYDLPRLLHPEQSPESPPISGTIRSS